METKNHNVFKILKKCARGQCSFENRQILDPIGSAFWTRCRVTFGDINAILLSNHIFFGHHVFEKLFGKIFKVFKLTLSTSALLRNFVFLFFMIFVIPFEENFVASLKILKCFWQLFWFSILQCWRVADFGLFASRVFASAWPGASRPARLETIFFSMSAGGKMSPKSKKIVFFVSSKGTSFRNETDEQWTEMTGRPGNFFS